MSKKMRRNEKRVLSSKEDSSVEEEPMLNQHVVNKSEDTTPAGTSMNSLNLQTSVLPPPSTASALSRSIANQNSIGGGSAIHSSPVTKSHSVSTQAIPAKKRLLGLSQSATTSTHVGARVGKSLPEAARPLSGQNRHDSESLEMSKSSAGVLLKAESEESSKLRLSPILKKKSYESSPNSSLRKSKENQISTSNLSISYNQNELKAQQSHRDSFQSSAQTIILNDLVNSTPNVSNLKSAGVSQFHLSNTTATANNNNQSNQSVSSPSTRPNFSNSNAHLNTSGSSSIYNFNSNKNNQSADNMSFRKGAKINSVDKESVAENGSEDTEFERTNSFKRFSDRLANLPAQAFRRMNGTSTSPTKSNLQAQVYNFLERPTGWKCFIYHFTV